MSELGKAVGHGLYQNGADTRLHLTQVLKHDVLVFTHQFTKRELGLCTYSHQCSCRNQKGELSFQPCLIMSKRFSV
jgi:hypothetical protein